VAKKCFVANKKMSNKTNFRNAKMNISSALTKDYENEQLGRPDQNKTNIEDPAEFDRCREHLLMSDR